MSSIRWCGWPSVHWHSTDLEHDQLWGVLQPAPASPGEDAQKLGFETQLELDTIEVDQAAEQLAPEHRPEEEEDGDDPGEADAPDCEEEAAPPRRRAGVAHDGSPGRPSRQAS